MKEGFELNLVMVIMAVELVCELVVMLKLKLDCLRLNLCELAMPKQFLCQKKKCK